MSIFGMMTTGGGTSMAAPDVCMTPGVSAGAPGPLPYPNNGSCSDGDGFAKVKCSSSPAMQKNGKLSKSAGDNAGNSPGGQVSGGFAQCCKVTNACSKVKGGGKQLARQTSMLGHNGNNANMPAGVHGSPSQTKVKVGS